MIWRLILLLIIGVFMSSFTVSANGWLFTNMTYRLDLNCTGLNSSYVMPIVVNGSNGFNLGSGCSPQWVWLLCNVNTNISIYYNQGNCTDYIIANTSDVIPYQVEWGNQSSNNPTDVWQNDNSTRVVYHLTDLSSAANVTNTTLTNLGTTPQLDTNLCKFGKCYNFTAASSQCLVNPNRGADTNITAGNNITVMFWERIASMPGGAALRAVFTIRDAAGFDLIDYGNSYAAGKVNWSLAINAGGISAGDAIDSGWTTGVWNFVVNTWNATGDTYYKDGVLVGGKSYTGSSTNTRRNITLGCMHIAAYQDYFDGTLDEFRYMNRSLAGWEVNWTYMNMIGNASFGSVGSPQFTPNPLNVIVFTPAAPSNLTYSYNFTPTFTFYVPQIGDSFNVSLFFNGSRNSNFTNVTSTGYFNMTPLTPLTAGLEYSWYFNATDNANATIMNVTEKRNIFISPGSGGSVTQLGCLIASDECSFTAGLDCNYLLGG